jgi:amidase
VRSDVNVYTLRCAVEISKRVLSEWKCPRPAGLGTRQGNAIPLTSCLDPTTLGGRFRGHTLPLADSMDDHRCDRRQFLKVASLGVAGASIASDEPLEPTGEPAWTESAKQDDLCFMSARDLAALIRTRKVSAREVMAAHVAQIDRVNPKVNAIVAKLDDRACLALAEAADQQKGKAGTPGPLFGLPIAIKDLQPAVGFPFTRGSPIYRDLMPAEDSLIVERLRKAGAIIIGKTNVPEFGLGSHTYNTVYGATRNPYDLTKSAGGSSGGAAAALATGMLPIADGSDFGGSLRNPGNFNNVVGLRPTVGLVPVAPSAFPFLGFAVLGPLARSVSDVGLVLSAIAGADPRDPGSYPANAAAFRGSLERKFAGTRVAWCPDLGGLPLDAGVRTVLESQRAVFQRLGCIVEEACPDLTGADSIFMTIRGFRNAALNGPLLARYRSQIKPEAIAEIESGAKLTGSDVAQAMMQHSQLLERVRRFQEKYEFILCAVNQIPPFDVTVDWPRSINGVPMDNYLAWMKSAYWITVTFRPAISVPAGFTAEGLPVGIQIVGRYRDDFGLLQLAHSFEQATGVGKRRPAVARASG